MALKFLNNGYFAGKVGIGIQSPTGVLHIKTTNDSTFWLAKIEADGTTQNAILATTDTTSGTGVRFDLGGQTGSFTVLNSGKVGIGTASPSEKLEVAGQYGNTKLNGHVVAYTRAAGNYLWASAVGGDLRFTVNGNLVGSPAMMISTAGNVGIGTISPDYQLEVENTSAQATVGITGGNTDARLNLKNNEGTWLIQNDYSNAGALSFYNSTHRVVITKGGNVGIGTTTPAGLLHLSSTSPSIYIEDTDATNTYNITRINGAGGNLSFDTRRSSDGGFVSTDYQIVKGSTGADYQRWFTVGAERMRITSTGNVGIGTTTPGSVLHVSGGSTTIPTLSGSHPFTISNTNNSGMSIISGTDDAGQIVFGDESDADVGRLRYQHSDNSMRFWTNASERMRITSTGNVGIGTTSPTEKLVVQDGKVLAGHTNTRGYGFHDLSNYSYTANTGRLSLVTNGVEAVSIDSNQNVGIGTTSPGAKLEISHGGANNGLLLENTLNSSNHQIALNIRQNEGLIFQRWIGGAFNANLMRIGYYGAIKFDAYNSTNNTGTPTYLLGTDASGNVVKTLSTPGGDPGPYLPLAGGTMTGTTGVVFPDAFKLNLGTGSDLQIYHTGSNNISFITNSNAGGLRLQSNELRIFAQNGSTIRADFNTAVKLYYNDSKKFETTNTGVTVTGNIDLPSNGAILFDNTSNIEQYYIRNGGGSQSSLQVGKGTPGSDIKFSLDDTGNATFTGNLETQGALSVRDASSNHQVRIQATVGGTSRIMAHNGNIGTNHDLDIVSTQIDFLTGSISGGDNSRALFLDSSRNATFTGVVDVRGSGSGYNAIRLVNNTTANSNKQTGITTLNYVGNNVSIMQYATNASANTVYYGSADSAHSGISNHRFYVNADPNTPSSGHTQALHIASNTNATFAGSVTATSFSSSAGATFNPMATIEYSDISTGENRGLRIINTSGTDQQWNITAGVTGSENESFCIRDATANVNALTMAASSGNATFAGVLSLPDGSAGAPAISNTGDANTGMYWPGDHQVGFTVNNSRKFYIAETKAYFQNLSSGVEINAGGIDVTGDSTFAGHIIPAADATYDLGTTVSKDFRTLFVRNIDVYNQRLFIETTGTLPRFFDHPTVGDGFQFMHLGTEILRLGNGSSTTATFAGKATSLATAALDGGTTLTTKSYVDGLVTGVPVYKGTWAAGTTGVTSAAISSTTITLTAAPTETIAIGDVVTADGITAAITITAVGSQTSVTVNASVTIASGVTVTFSPAGGYPNLTLNANKVLGNYYIVSTAGNATPNGTGTKPDSWAVGDWCIFSDVTPGAGTDLWQRIDNSSVISGAGTGGTIPLWEGATNAVSETLTDSPITVSGNSSSFAGTITITGTNDLRVDNGSLTSSQSSTTNPVARFTNTGVNNYDFTFPDNSTLQLGSSVGGDLVFKLLNAGAGDFNLDVGGNATFAGTIGIGTAPTTNAIEIDGDDGTSYIYLKSSAATTGARVGLNSDDLIIENKQASGDMIFDTNSTERMRVDSSGNVGIGVIPEAWTVFKTLQIGQASSFVGRISSNQTDVATNWYYDGAEKRIASGYAQRYTQTADGEHQFFTAGTDSADSAITFSQKLTIKNNGNVGIGTTTPLAPLHVVTPEVSGVDLTDISRTANNLVRFTNPRYSTSATMGLLLRVFPDSDARQGAGLLMTGGSDNAASNLSLFVSKDDGTGSNISQSYSALHITGNTGRVGIGTTSPLTKLHIAGTTDANIIRIENTSTSLSLGSTIGAIQFFNNDPTDDSPNVAASIYATAGASGGSGALRFKTTEPGTEGDPATDTMIITNGGRVGIGTDSPGAKLHVKSASAGSFTYDTTADDLIVESNANGGITIATAAANTGRIIFASPDDATGSEISFNQASTLMKLGTTTGSGILALQSGNGSEAMRIDSSGNVGIGVTSPNDKLNVQSDALGSAVGSQIRQVVFSANDGNTTHLEIKNIRTSTTQNWTGAAKRIQCRVDSTYMGYMQFNGTGNNYGISFGTGGTTTAPGNVSERMVIDQAGAIKFNAYDSTNKTGTPTYLLGTDASGNVVKTLTTPSPVTSQAASLYDLIPNGAFTTTYAFTSTAGTYAEVMKGDDVITANGTYTVQMFVNDHAVGGTQYSETYSGIMSWGSATNTNDTGGGTISQIVLHRSGHAANQGMTYLRTRETTNSEGNELRLEIMCNRTYSAASNVVFKFVRLI